MHQRNRPAQTQSLLITARDSTVRQCTTPSLCYLIDLPVIGTRLFGMEAPLGGRHCFNCGVSAKHACSKCKVARYCSAECQRTHWPAHKASCKVDAQAPSVAPEVEATQLKHFSSSCHHGAPGPVAAGALLGIAIEIATGLAQDVHRDQRVEYESTLVLGIVARNPVAAADPKLRQILTSMAVDAFYDTNLGIAMLMMRICGSLAEYEARGPQWLQLTPSQRMTHFLSAEGTGSRIGLLTELRSRIPCRCLK